jgi:hypothetical protein
VEVDMKLTHVLGAAMVVGLACSHYDSSGRRVRTGSTRFDAQSVSGPGFYYTLGEDGIWSGMSGDQYERVGDDIRKVGAYGPTPSIIRPSGSVTITRRPDGLQYVPSYLSAPVWTFVTADSQPIPQEMEIPLYLAARLGLSGQWISLKTPGSETTGIPLEAGCATVLFEMQGRQIAGWTATQGTACPDPRYPGPDVLAKLVNNRNEIWESPARPPPP